jgi:hypothetical protein
MGGRHEQWICSVLTSDDAGTTRIGRGFYVRAGRSSSSSPPGMSAKAERRFRALGAVVVKLLMEKTLAEFAHRRKWGTG